MGNLIKEEIRWGPKILIADALTDVQLDIEESIYILNMTDRNCEINQ